MSYSRRADYPSPNKAFEIYLKESLRNPSYMQLSHPLHILTFAQYFDVVHLYDNFGQMVVGELCFWHDVVHEQEYFDPLPYMPLSHI